jgi:hypothetical protein
MEPGVARLPRLIPRTVFAESFRVIDIVGQGSMGSVYEVERRSQRPE